MDANVYVVKTKPSYPDFPYESSEIDQALDQLFIQWGKDPVNPFGKWVQSGGRVVIKPNWVLNSNPLGHGLDSLITHAALIKAVIDRAAVALNNEGSIIIGDAPLQSCNFKQMMQQGHFAEMLDHVQHKYPGIRIEMEDWRLTLREVQGSHAEKLNITAQTLRENHDSLQESNFEIVDLKENSFLEEIADYSDDFRVTCYQPSLMASHHYPGKHEYLVTKRIFQADLLINLPKMKTHIKAGITGALKNLVGINGHKEFLPHHIRGAYTAGGDCYYATNRLRKWYDELYDEYWEKNQHLSPRQRKWRSFVLALVWAVSRKQTGDRIDAGSWSGNETIWRTTLDLNHILYFSENSPAHVISIVDGIIAGEAEGPLSPSPRPAGVLIAGENPAYVDAVMAKLMGYNIARIPTIYHAITHHNSRFSGPKLESFEVEYMEGDVHFFDPVPISPKLGLCEASPLAARRSESRPRTSWRSRKKWAI